MHAASRPPAAEEAAIDPSQRMPGPAALGTRHYVQGAAVEYAPRSSVPIACLSRSAAWGDVIMAGRPSHSRVGCPSVGDDGVALGGYQGHRAHHVVDDPLRPLVDGTPRLAHAWLGSWYQYWAAAEGLAITNPVIGGPHEATSHHVLGWCMPIGATALIAAAHRRQFRPWRALRPRIAASRSVDHPRPCRSCRTGEVVRQVRGRSRPP